jgi:hypothetical protein
VFVETSSHRNSELDDHYIEGSLPVEVNYELEAIMDEFKFLVGRTFKECIEASVPYNVRPYCECPACDVVGIGHVDKKEALRLAGMIETLKQLVLEKEERRRNYIEWLKAERAKKVVLVALGR